MECAPSYVAGALLRGDQRRRPIPASILLNTICVDDPRIPTLGIGGFYVVKKVRREKNKMFPTSEECSHNGVIIAVPFSRHRVNDSVFTKPISIVSMLILPSLI